MWRPVRLHIEAKKYAVHLSDEPTRCTFPMNCLYSTCRFTLIPDGGQLTGMYGPPLRRKRIVRMSQVGLRKCIRPLLEWITPGQDGMRCALLPISYSVFRDFFRLRV